MISVLARPSWSDIEKGTAHLALTITKTRVSPDFIVGVNRGGLVPAVILSHMLDVPLIPVSYSSKDGAGDDKNHSNVLPTIGDSFATPQTLLIVDDIADTGHTLAELTRHYRSQGNHVLTVSLYRKEFPVLVPDFAWQVISDDDPWIVFPWER